MFGTLDISTSGMIVQRTRMDAIAANIANANSLRDAKTGQLNPYQRREVFVAPGDPSAATAEGRRFGAHVVEIAPDQTAPPLPTVYAPGSPDAYVDGPYKGYIPINNIDPVREHVNAIEAFRAYEANVMAAEATKQMIASALRLLA